MKLYTEEQVIFMLNRARIHNIDDTEMFTNEHLLSHETPIELPSDEEIEDKGKWVFNNAGHTIFTHYNTVPSWVDGAKWMKEQILTQNK